MLTLGFVSKKRKFDNHWCCMKGPFKRPVLRTGLFYPEPVLALDFLEMAFGFERRCAIWDKNNQLVHAEMKLGAAEIVVDGEWTDYVSSPNSLAGKNTQLTYIQLENDIDAHCERAVANGAEIIEGLDDQFYGDRTYRAKDIRGHIWTFSKVVKHAPQEEAERISGLRIEGWWSEDS